MTLELLARIGGPVAVTGLALLILARGSLVRLAGLAAGGVGTLLLLALLVPHGHWRLLAGGAVVGILVAIALAAILRRSPWVLPFLILLATPARIPVSVGSTEANLLVPLYVVVVAAGLALAWELALDVPKSRELGALGWPLAGLVAWLGVSEVWTDDVRKGAIALVFFLVPFTLLAVGVSRLSWRRRPLAGLYALLAGMTVLFAGLGIWQWATRDVFWNPKVIVGNVYQPFFRVNSAFWDPSIYGRFLAIGILASVALLLFRLRFPWAPVLVLVIVVAWIGLLFSFSQSSFLAVLAGTVLAVGAALRARVLIGAALVAALLLVATHPPASYATQTGLVAQVSSNGADRATGGRLRLVKTGLKIAASHPVLGTGLGSFQRAYAKRLGLKRKAPPSAASHTTPVTVAAEAGFPGLALLLWLVGACLVVSVRLLRGATLAQRAGAIGAVVFAAIFVHSLFYNAFFEDPLVWGSLALVALAAANREVEAL